MGTIRAAFVRNTVRFTHSAAPALPMPRSPPPMQMESALETQQKILDKAYPQRDKNKGQDNIRENLTRMIACYRDMKTDRKAISFNRMMKRYSDAIESYNRIVRYSPLV